MVSYYTQLDDDRGVDAEIAEMERDNLVDRLLEKQAEAKISSVGSTIECPVCKHRFVKNSYQQVFCSNQYKKRNGLNCKDRFNNIINPRGIYARWYEQKDGEAA